MESDTHLHFTKLSGKSLDFYFLVGIHLNLLTGRTFVKVPEYCHIPLTCCSDLGNKNKWSSGLKLFKYLWLWHLLDVFRPHSYLKDVSSSLRGSVVSWGPRRRLWRTRASANTTHTRYVMMTSSNGNIFRVTGPLCGNSPVPVNSPHKGQWRGALMFSLICVWINGWVNNREAGDLSRHRGHYDAIVMYSRVDIWRYLLFDLKVSLMWLQIPLNTIRCIYT